MNTIRFTKMHGLGNDYVYVDCFAQPLRGVNPPELARRLSDRHRGVGSDGLILITPPEGGVSADVRMEMYNADGSRGEMCGNGIRCVAKYAVEHGLIPRARGETTDLRVETDRGVLMLRCFLKGDNVTGVRVNMGPPILRPAEIPVKGSGERLVRLPHQVDGVELTITCVSMGNPHAVAFVDNLDEYDLPRIGPMIEHASIFPKRINFHLARIESRSEVTMRTWERGSGMTQACGTGACAVLVAGVLESRLDRAATIHLPGGELLIEWPELEGETLGAVFMTGPAEEVFTGEWRC